MKDLIQIQIRNKRFMSLPYLFSFNWYNIPYDIIFSIVQYLSAHDVLYLCLHNDSFNSRVCHDSDSIIWKFLYQRDISPLTPSTDISGKYLDILDHILALTPNARLIYGAQHGYDEIVKNALDAGANIHVEDDVALRFGSREGTYRDS